MTELKFDDLVRNYTHTAGTGSFVLGPAVSGFRGFSEAVAPGEQFYYSAIGIDKPEEREVGRGVMLPGGRVSRDPINGPPTDFSSGAKSIAMIAPSEWFNR